MNNNRRQFLKKACFSGACMCGFTALVKASTEEDIEPDSNKLLMYEWISSLMQSIDENEDENMSRQIMKKCAVAHYNHLKMDDLLKPYEGNLEKFNQFIENEWGWKIDFQKEKGILIADENKNFCVCPMVNQEKGVKSSILCFCSEGFAELMFSKVAGYSVTAKIISSIHRGDDRCKYEISLD